MLELILSLAVIGLILYMGRMGTSFGLFYELTSMVLLFFAMLVTMRYWHLMTRAVESVIPISGAYATFVGYWVMFLIGCLPLIVAMRVITEDSRPKYPAALDNLLGFAFGLVSAAILFCSVMTSLSVIIPKLYEPYERTALLLQFDEYPIRSYRFVERDIFGVDPEDPHHTRMPTLDKSDLDDSKKFWR